MKIIQLLCNLPEKQSVNPDYTELKEEEDVLALINFISNFSTRVAQREPIKSKLQSIK